MYFKEFDSYLGVKKFEAKMNYLLKLFRTQFRLLYQSKLDFGTCVPLGEPTGIRTRNQEIKSLLLYR